MIKRILLLILSCVVSIRAEDFSFNNLQDWVISSSYSDCVFFHNSELPLIKSEMGANNLNKFAKKLESSIIAISLGGPTSYIYLTLAGDLKNEGGYINNIFSIDNKISDIFRDTVFSSSSTTFFKVGICDILYHENDIILVLYLYHYLTFNSIGECIYIFEDDILSGAKLKGSWFNGIDFNIFLGVNSTSSTILMFYIIEDIGDLNRDGIVNFIDFSMLCKDYQEKDYKTLDLIIHNWLKESVFNN
jgi:hypothetical protein